jgi:2-polyprenyl-6-hydroxyphenyl methylase/3-demethylubiquinone-9 3-methyltransferase
VSTTHADEVKRGQRFEFGENWRLFLDVLDDDRIEAATRSLTVMLGRENLAGCRFLDIGSGSGLFSLAARRLGAQVVSMDYDPESVACARYLRGKYLPDDSDWIVTEGSVLDRQFMASLGSFDVVYSWGVLHHTGEMWKAIEMAAGCVAPTGSLALAIYNDQGPMSRRWLILKRWYNALPDSLRLPYTVLVMGARELRPLISYTLRLRPWAYFRRYREPSGPRGMSYWRDMVDWIGGYPFEVARPEEVFRFVSERGFDLSYLTTCAGGLGCNEFAFSRRVDMRSRRQLPDRPGEDL